jgi:hypothetical protein
MRLSFLVCLASFGWLAGIHGAVAGVPARLDDPYTNEGETQTFTVSADGSFSKLDSMTLHVNNEAGVARVAQQYVWFNRNMADVQILEATRPPAMACVTTCSRSRSATSRKLVRSTRRCSRTSRKR